MALERLGCPFWGSRVESRFFYKQCWKSLQADATKQSRMMLGDIFFYDLMMSFRFQIYWAQIIECKLVFYFNNFQRRTLIFLPSQTKNLNFQCFKVGFNQTIWTICLRCSLATVYMQQCSQMPAVQRTNNDGLCLSCQVQTIFWSNIKSSLEFVRCTWLQPGWGLYLINSLLGLTYPLVDVPKSLALS